MAESDKQLTLDIDIEKTKNSMIKDLKIVAEQIDKSNAFKIQASLDTAKTKSNLQNQLNTIAKDIKMNPVDININGININNASNILGNLPSQIFKTITAVATLKTSLNAIGSSTVGQGVKGIFDAFGNVGKRSILKIENYALNSFMNVA